MYLLWLWIILFKKKEKKHKSILDGINRFFNWNKINRKRRRRSFPWKWKFWASLHKGSWNEITVVALKSLKKHGKIQKPSWMKYSTSTFKNYKSSKIDLLLGCSIIQIFVKLNLPWKVDLFPFLKIKFNLDFSFDTNLHLNHFFNISQNIANKVKKSINFQF